MSARVVAAIDNVHMGLSHVGLALLAKKFRIDVQTLGQSELVVFINRARNKLKIIGGGGNVIAYTRSEKSRKLPLGAIQYIAQVFADKGHIDLDAEIEKHLKQALEERTKQSQHILYRSRNKVLDLGQVRA